MIEVCKISQGKSIIGLQNLFVPYMYLMRCTWDCWKYSISFSNSDKQVEHVGLADSWSYKPRLQKCFTKIMKDKDGLLHGLISSDLNLSGTCDGRLWQV